MTHAGPQSRERSVFRHPSILLRTPNGRDGPAGMKWRGRAREDVLAPLLLQVTGGCLIGSGGPSRFPWMCHLTKKESAMPHQGDCPAIDDLTAMPLAHGPSAMASALATDSSPRLSSPASAGRICGSPRGSPRRSPDPRLPGPQRAATGGVIRPPKTACSDAATTKVGRRPSCCSRGSLRDPRPRRPPRPRLPRAAQARGRQLGRTPPRPKDHAARSGRRRRVLAVRVLGQARRYRAAVARTGPRPAHRLGRTRAGPRNGTAWISRRSSTRKALPKCR